MEDSDKVKPIEQSEIDEQMEVLYLPEAKQKS